MSHCEVHVEPTASSVDDSDALLRALCARDVLAFEQVYRELRGRLAAVVRRVGVGESLVEDVVQEVFQYLWEHPERVDGRRGSLSAFLCTVAHHRAVDVVRSEHARRRRVLLHAGAQQPLVWDEDAVDVAERVARAEVRRARARCLVRALQELPLDQVKAVTLTYANERTVTSVAAELGVPVGTLKWRMRTASTRLRASLRLSEPMAG